MIKDNNFKNLNAQNLKTNSLQTNLLTFEKQSGECVFGVTSITASGIKNGKTFVRNTNATTINLSFSSAQLISQLNMNIGDKVKITILNNYDSSFNIGLTGDILGPNDNGGVLITYPNSVDLVFTMINSSQIFYQQFISLGGYT